jgi:hypothetical protein
LMTAGVLADKWLVEPAGVLGRRLAPPGCGSPDFLGVGVDGWSDWDGDGCDAGEDRDEFGDPGPGGWYS